MSPEGFLSDRKGKVIPCRRGTADRKGAGTNRIYVYMYIYTYICRSVAVTLR